MEYSGSLYRPSTTEPATMSASAATSDSIARPITHTGAVAYSSVAPTARMQIITRPLSGVPTDGGIKLSSRERFRLVVAIIITGLFLAFLAFMLAISNVTEVSAEPNPIDAVQRLIFVILALIFIGVGGPVYVKAKQRVAASAFYAFCVSSAVCLAIVIASSLGQSWIRVLMFISLMIWSGSFAFFFFKFPVRAGKTRRRHRLLVATIFATGAITIGSYLFIFAFYPDQSQLARI